MVKMEPSYGDELRLRAQHVAAATFGMVAMSRRGTWSQKRLRVPMGLLTYAAMASTTRALIRAVHHAETAEFEEQVRVTLAGAFLQMTRLGLPPEALGLQAFVARHRLVPPYSLHLSRIAKIRLASLPRSSALMWTPGKGVVGHCWNTQKLVVMDTEAAYAPYLDGDEARWLRAPKDVRLGLSWEEFKIIGPRYSRVVAAPIRLPDGTVRGCVAADLVAGSVAHEFTEDAQEALAQAALVIGNALERVPRWLYA